jgi:translation initiation factor 1 (eIF-1/SUI1)
MTFDQAHRIIEKLDKEQREIERLDKEWTEEDVRARLKEYNKDDALYDARIARPSQMNISHSSSADPMPRMIQKILKRADLDMAIEGALLTKTGRVVTREQREKRKLYRLIRAIYVSEWSMGELADSMEVDITTIRRREKKAVSLISGYLNMRLSQLKSNNHAGLY